MRSGQEIFEPAPAPDAPAVAWAPTGWPSERPSDDPDALEAWCYTPRWSYRHGETVDLHVYCTEATYSLTVLRDGARPEVVLEQASLPGARAHTPENAYEVGCGWPVSHRFTVQPKWKPGLYLVVVAVERAGHQPFEREHFIVVRPREAGSTARNALLLTTSTLLAYNDWGGANHYRGIGDDPHFPIPATTVSAQRPVGRGFLRVPPGAPREANSAPATPHEPPRYESLEWSQFNGYSRHYCDAFWSNFERPFVVWAEENGYDFEYLTQTDLHAEPDSLDAYDAVVIVGHDEYWSWEMRDVVDAFVDRGGHLVRLGGNFVWQVRFNEELTQQTCFKLGSHDPYHGTPGKEHLVTTAWDFVGRPGAQTMGVTGLAGIYCRYGAAVPRSSGGFTVYRPEHWALEGTDLRYGDLLGGMPVGIAGFEMDGLDYTFRYGLPYPTGSDAPPDDVEIIALTPAVLGETDLWDGRHPMNAPISEALVVIHDHFGQERGDEELEKRRYGSGMIVSFTRGSGWVFCAGSTEWVCGLMQHDPFVEQITRNVLDRAQKGTA